MLGWLSALLLLLSVACSAGDPARAPVEPIEGGLAAPPDGSGVARIDMSGRWRISSFEIEDWDELRYAPTISPEGQEFEIERAANGRYRLRSFGWIADLERDEMAQGWIVDFHRNEGDGRLLLFGLSTRPPPGTLFPATIGLRKSYAIGIALGSLDERTMLGQFVEAGIMQAGSTSFVFTAQRVHP